ncbi:MAG: glycoside hydrolase family 3 N-terminal domain-containing protein [Nitrospirota bacterium]
MDNQRKIAQLLIARLDGRDITKKYDYYRKLVRQGIGGFIIFGGKLKEVRDGIRRLQREAEIPLFISSDLERGLGQHIEGGTLFPPAMAFARAVDPKDKNDLRLLREAIDIMSLEAKVVGINIIFAPVVDVNINPQNPIICTRAFSDNPTTVAWFGREFVNGIQKHGPIACAKHFPGHGDTAKDSHRELPVVKADMARLKRVELYPFKEAINAGVRMVMAGHLKVIAIDPKYPASLSEKTLKIFLKKKMGFEGLVITDAMNMEAVSKIAGGSCARACLMALNAGADILLHPDNPEEVIDFLSSQSDEIMPEVDRALDGILRVKKGLVKSQSELLSIRSVGTKSHQETAGELIRKSLKKINTGILPKEKLAVLIIDDDNAHSGKNFIKTLKKSCKKVKTIYVDNKSKPDMQSLLNSLYGRTLVAAVFSKVSAWKGRSDLSRELKALLKKAVRASQRSIVVGFCSPYILQEIKADEIINAYSDSEQAQEIVSEMICKKHHGH